MKTILVVDDKASVRQLVEEYLTGQGYKVVTADNGRNALYTARFEKPDLVLLDVMMPEMDGFDFIRAFRKERDTPIILLTARMEESDKVIGLELGADDYVTKPFGMRELVARVRAVLRRAESDAQKGEILRSSDIELDPDMFSVKVAGEMVELTRSEFDLLAALMRFPGRVYSRMELLEHLQGGAYEGVERTIDVHVRNLRLKIEPDPANPIYVQTVFGVGYRFATESETA
ncbi:MAG: response regulator transcription factor [Anaerolineales bacterium]|nr:response regulator transcription factor [Anaerolineales bacterium]